MLRRKPACIVLAMAVALAALPAGAQAAQGGGAAENAALDYWRAFALMPSLSQQQEEIMLDRGPLEEEPEGTDKLLREFAPALHLMHRASRAPRCDWGVDYVEEGTGALLPHLGKARKLARGAVFRARARWARGEPEEAVEDLVAAVRTARHVGANGRETLISLLVQVAMEEMTLRTAARHLRRPADAAALQRLIRQVGPPDGQLVHNVFLAEKAHFITPLRRRLEEGIQPPGWEDMISGMDLPERPDRAQMISWLQETEKHYEEAARLAALPPSEAGEKYAAFGRQVKQSSNPLAGMWLPIVRKVPGQEFHLRVHWAMLGAGVALVRDGKQALKEVEDPATGGTFRYTSLDGGFRLTSEFTYRGEPVSLTFGGAAAAQEEPDVRTYEVTVPKEWRGELSVGELSLVGPPRYGVPWDLGLWPVARIQLPLENLTADSLYVVVDYRSESLRRGPGNAQTRVCYTLDPRQKRLVDTFVPLGSVEKPTRFRIRVLPLQRLPTHRDRAEATVAVVEPFPLATPEPVEDQLEVARGPNMHFDAIGARMAHSEETGNMLLVTVRNKTSTERPLGCYVAVNDPEIVEKKSPFGGLYGSFSESVRTVPAKTEAEVAVPCKVPETKPGLVL
ncbi:MAG: hypothetical protein PVJ27_04390, partial [Candidatus Brocadiaceae bacterium]